MKNKPLILVCLFFLTSCIEVNDFGDYSKKTVIDDSVLGNWRSVEDADVGGVSGSSAAETDDYQVSQQGRGYLAKKLSNGSESFYRLFKFGPYHFCSPNVKIGPNSKSQAVITKYDINNDTLIIYGLDPNKANSFIEENYSMSPKIQAVSRPGGTIYRIKILDSDAEQILITLASHDEFWVILAKLKRVKQSSL